MEFKAYFNIATEDGTQVEKSIAFNDEAWMCKTCFEEDILKEFNIEEAELTYLSLTGYNTIADVTMYSWNLAELGSDTISKWEELWDWCKAMQAKIDEAVECFWDHLNDAKIEG